VIKRGAELAFFPLNQEYATTTTTTAVDDGLRREEFLERTVGEQVPR
jgi:hypothetical protein